MVASIKFVTLAFCAAFVAACQPSGQYILPVPLKDTGKNTASTVSKKARSTTSPDVEMVAPQQGSYEPGSSPNSVPHNLESASVSETKEEYEARSAQWIRCIDLSKPRVHFFRAGGSWISDAGKLEKMLQDKECRPYMERTYDNGKDFGDGNLTFAFMSYCGPREVVNAAIDLTREAQVNANLPQTPLVVYNCGGFQSDPRIIYVKDDAGFKQTRGNKNTPLVRKGRSPACHSWGWRDGI
ncbi:hypothetical protein NW762_008598 [Fusarium torreyae]|uniref:Uncharacterized protein n=1 Tax=Fusarium torreyae TaxID=1237075 RepID=A0A9W8VD84_9HYPO|nr:hypothetical protein NW762_008598 [Fusarium torreyae]